jgi:hypothetical protein
MAKKKESLPLTPEQRSLRARCAAYVLHSQRDSSELLAAAHQASHVTKFEREVDPDNVLPPEERARRLESARRAYLTRLALASSRARAERKAAAS